MKKVFIRVFAVVFAAGLLPMTPPTAGNAATVSVPHEAALRAALSPGANGDAVLLGADITLNSELKVERSVLLDLNGHNLTIDIPDAAGRTSSGITMNAVPLSLRDSVGGGKLSVINRSTASQPGCGAAINTTGSGIVINDCAVEATGGQGGAGIGGGKGGAGSGVVIGPTGNAAVIATGGAGAAGIGGGSGGASGRVVIAGGTVEATGGANAPGIGHGNGAPFNANLNDSVDIVGGTVIAIGGANGDGIRCGGYVAIGGSFGHTTPNCVVTAIAGSVAGQAVIGFDGSGSGNDTLFSLNKGAFYCWTNTTPADPGGAGALRTGDTPFANDPSYKYLRFEEHTYLSSAPRNLTLTPGYKQIAASWEAPSDTGGRAVVYKIQLDGGPVIEKGQSLSHVFTGLNGGTDYTVTVWAANVVGESAAVSESAATIGAVVVPSDSKDGAAINLTDETLDLDGFAPAHYSVAAVPGKSKKWVEYKDYKFDLGKLLDKGWASLQFRAADGMTIVSFPAVEKRGKAGGKLGVKLGVWYPKDSPAAWVLADKAKFRYPDYVEPISDGFEYCTYRADKKPSNDWIAVSADGFAIKGTENNKVVKTAYAIREAAKEEGGKYYPASKLMKVTASSYGKPTSFNFKGKTKLKLKAGTMYSIDGGAPIGPAIAGEADFAAHAGKQAVFWMAANGKKPQTTPQAGVVVPAAGS